MISSIVHPVITAKNEKRGMEMWLRRDSLEYLFNNTVHFQLFWEHVRTGMQLVLDCKIRIVHIVPFWPRFVTYVVKPKKMQNHAIPVALLKLLRYVSCYIIINFGEILV